MYTFTVHVGAPGSRGEVQRGQIKGKLSDKLTKKANSTKANQKLNQVQSNNFWRTAVYTSTITPNIGLTVILYSSRLPLPQATEDSDKPHRQQKNSSSLDLPSTSVTPTHAPPLARSATFTPPDTSNRQQSLNQLEIFNHQLRTLARIKTTTKLVANHLENTSKNTPLTTSDQLDVGM